MYSSSLANLNYSYIHLVIHLYMEYARFMIYYLQNATMQVILVTDGLYSYIMFNYDQELWSLKPESHDTVSAGYSLENSEGYILANKNNMSQLNSESNVEPGIDNSIHRRNYNFIIK